MNLHRRLRAMEQIVVLPDDDRCETCGYERGSELKFEVSLDGEPLEGPDVCRACGRMLILRLEFDSPLGIDRPQIVPPSGWKTLTE